MLNNLHVKNLALIDEIEVEFGKGLNILTGETGAGKSIVIGSLGLALGDRADSDAIRVGAEYALVELSLITDEKSVWDKLSELGIGRESDEILIQRRIYPGRSVCRINGETITLKELSSISELLIDICGQRDSLKLLKNTALKKVLDECGDEDGKLSTLLSELSQNYKEYCELKAKLEEIDEDDGLRKRKADLAQFELDEIDSAKLVIGEDEQLEADYRRMQHFAKISEALGVIDMLFSGSNGGASEAISRALREIRNVSEYDERVLGIESMLGDLDGLSSDITREIHNYLDSSDYDAEAFSYTSERLNLINRLKDKYGRTIELVHKYRDSKEEEIDKLMDHDAYLNRLNAQIDEHEKLLTKLCEKVHDIRCEAAKELSKKLVSSLKDMNFENCELLVTVEAQPGRFSATGYDDVDFLISLNPGEPLKSLSQVASGGELSRIMLALKCVTGERDNIETMVFDEIDTGISGVTAWKVAEKMSEVSANRQVICITHQAQIAAFANSHFLIEKHMDTGRMLTKIHSLSREDMVLELARMMGADHTSDAAVKAAYDLKEKAEATYQ